MMRPLGLGKIAQGKEIQTKNKESRNAHRQPFPDARNVPSLSAMIGLNEAEPFF